MTNENFETLIFNVIDDVGYLSINRPGKLNSLNIQVLRELKSALMGLAKLPLKGLIFSGEGEKAFIAGADIAEMKSMSTDEGHAFSELGQQVTLGFESLPYPTIACVNGFALGGGFEMALACDFIFASQSAVFGLPEVKLGLVPGFGGTQRLARIVGERRAKEILFSGRNIPSQEAKALGIALEVFADKDQLMSETRNWFKTISSNSAHAIARAKLALKQGMELRIEEGLRVEREEFGNIFTTEDMLEGTAAFLEKRPAKFKGKSL
jgi:enoyl-CoA hydratase